MPDTLNRALALAAQSRERSVESLRGLVRIPSLTGEEGTAQTHLADVLRSLDAHTEVLDLDIAALFERYPHVAQYPTHWQHDLILPYAGLPTYAALEQSGLADVLSYEHSTPRSPWGKEKEDEESPRKDAASAMKTWLKVDGNTFSGAVSPAEKFTIDFSVKGRRREGAAAH